MFEELLIITLGMIRTLMGAARFGPHQGAVGNRLGHVDHIFQFQGGRQFCIEGQAVVRQLDLEEPFLQFPKVDAGFLQRTFVPIDAGPNFHLMSQFRSKPSDGFLATFRLKELFPNSFLFGLGLSLDFLSRNVVMPGMEPNRRPSPPSPRTPAAQ